MLNFASELSIVDNTLATAMCDFVRVSFPKLLRSAKVNSSLIMITRGDETIHYVKDTKANLDDFLNPNHVQLLIDECLDTKKLTRHTFASAGFPVDAIGIPIFSPSGVVVALVLILLDVAGVEEVDGNGGVVGTVEELTLYHCCVLMGLSSNIAGKSLLHSKLMVDDQVRKIQVESLTKTDSLKKWRKVSEVAHFLSAVDDNEGDLFLTEGMIADACEADGCSLYMLDEKSHSLVASGVGATAQPGGGKKFYIDGGERGSRKTCIEPQLKQNFSAPAQKTLSSAILQAVKKTPTRKT